MARPKKNKTNLPINIPQGKQLSPETKKIIWGIVSYLLGLSLLFGSFGIEKNLIGNAMHRANYFLFGAGFIVPILFFFSAPFWKKINHSTKIQKIELIFSPILFFSLLGTIKVLSPSSSLSGWFGAKIGLIFSNLFGQVLASMVLIALFIISLLIVFDTRISFPWLKKESEEDNKNLTDLGNTKEDPVDRAIKKIPTTVDDEDTEENIKKQPVSSINFPILKAKKEKSEEEIIKNNLDIFSFTPYLAPPIDILSKSKGKPTVGDIKASANIIQRTLANFNISVELDEVSIGPTITRFAVKPAEGVKLSRIVGLQNELALALAAQSIRVEAPIPGKSLVGIEIPNKTKTMLGLGSLLDEPEFKNSKDQLAVSLGKGVSGISFVENIAKMPHLLIAGATGSGKSVTVHSIIASLLYRNGPEKLRLIMVDPKRVELTLYNGIPHLLTPVIKDPKKAILALKWAAKEMDRRYSILEEESVRDISSYHSNIVEPAYSKINPLKISPEEKAKLPEKMPYIVFIIDELADIMQMYPKELESGIVRLAQMSRAVGIHLILSTQRPEVNVITGLIKANVPARLALRVASQIDSRTILDTGGAEKLLGNGDMLYLGGNSARPVRMQCAFIPEDEVKKVVQFLKNNNEELPDEINLESADTGSGSGNMFKTELGNEDGGDDDLYEEAKDIVSRAGKASTSYLQRKLRIGYARAARLMDILEEKGVIGPANGSKPREVTDSAKAEIMNHPGGLPNENSDTFNEDFDAYEFDYDRDKP